MLTGFWEKELSISCKMAQPDGSTLIGEIKAWVAQRIWKGSRKEAIE
jgi:hypothetical protein